MNRPSAPICPTLRVFNLPEGAGCSDCRWQEGYSHGFEDECPRSYDPVYVSGWCHGYCGADQCSAEEAEAAYDRWQDHLSRPEE